MKIKPSLSDLLNSSFRSILKNKGRTLLTSLGIIIGVSSVILLTSIGNGLKSYVSDQFETLGANTIFVSPGMIFSEGGRFNQGAEQFLSLSFDKKDISNLSRNFRSDTIIPLSQTSAEVKALNKTLRSISIIGTTDDYGQEGNATPDPKNGRWFSAEESAKGSKVAILGSNVATDLFGNVNPLGRKIIIKGKTLKVIGIANQQGSSFGGQPVDDYIYVPLDIVHSLSGNEDINSIQIKTPSKDEVPQRKLEIEEVLLDRYEKDTFTVFDSSQLLSSINIISVLTVALTGIAAISLIVGGIGIMNIMLVTVSERTREIGLRKAIGAYPRAILVQFLIEATILSGIGGIIGILLGTLGSLAINNFFPTNVTLQSVILAFGVSAIVGIVFGVAPARKASKLSPIEALRYE
jgi:putative ABC transport system permease protein